MANKEKIFINKLHDPIQVNICFNLDNTIKHIRFNQRDPHHGNSDCIYMSLTELNNIVEWVNNSELPNH